MQLPVHLRSAHVADSPFLVLVQGPPGTGKTTSILAVARQLLGANFKDAVLELNASDDRSAHTCTHTLTERVQCCACKPDLGYSQVPLSVTSTTSSSRACAGMHAV